MGSHWVYIYSQANEATTRLLARTARAFQDNNEKLREELAAQTAVVRSKMEAAHHAREAARHAFAELRREAKKEHLLKLDIEDLTNRFARAETGEDE